MEVELTGHGKETVCQKKNTMLPLRTRVRGFHQDHEHDLPGV